MSDLKRVIQLATLLVAQRALVEKLTKELTEEKEMLRRIETEDLPELMREIGMKSVTLEDGSSVEIVDEIDCAISEERRPVAHEWLIANGFGGLIKTEVSVAFGSGELEEATALAEELRGEDFEPSVVDRVHPATLKSFVKEQMAKGVTIPFDLFGIHPYSKVKLKKAK
jgi:hypothetical protein